MQRTKRLVWILFLAASSRDPLLSFPADAPVSLKEAPGRMTLPPGFNITLFAGEPDVRQPIAFAIDDRGRLWVAECYSYPNWQKEGRDRILILEDQDGDGRFDRRSVFWDKGANLTGLELGFGGAWVCSTPNLLFLPDRDGDDVPDAGPVVLLDGWDLSSKHNAFNALKWGPDGWLYGCNGILSSSRVGRPGAADSERVSINCGVWRYHPARQVFEAVAHGTTNPWGIDFDDYGEAFITNCVIPHLYHVVPGAHFQRMYGQDLDPNVYELMESCADHIHWAGGAWQESRGGKGKHGEAGGGHAHAGAMIYLGDNWPDSCRNTLFTCNIHGNRVNHDALQRSGSSYLGTHEKDFLLANDEWFRGLELKYGPDGSVFLTDWSDSGECHESDAHGAHHDSGRIYKVSYGQAPAVQVDLRGLSDFRLVELQLHKNDWYVRHARRLLQERSMAGKDMSQARQQLQEIFLTQKDATRQLRALWALHATGGLEEAFLRRQLDHASENVRSWAVRLLCEERRPSSETVAKLAALAEADPSPLVRLYLASVLQRVPFKDRWPVLENLVSHAEDAGDRYLPLMLWYGIEPLVVADGPRAVQLAARCKIPLVRRHLARRAALASAEGSGDSPVAGASALDGLIELLGKASDPLLERDLLTGMEQALRGRKKVSLPKAWPRVYPDLSRSPEPRVRELADLVALLLGDPQAVLSLRQALRDPAAGADRRHRALQALVEKGAPGLSEELQKLIDDRELRPAVLRALAASEDKATPEAILSRYRSLSESERADAIGTLSSRPAYALRLLDAVENGTVERRDLSAFIVRQLQAFHSPQIDEKLNRAWGSVRPLSREKSALIAKYKALLTPEKLKAADPAKGRGVFHRACEQCHRLFGAGGDVGPDLTGSQRANLDYVLENVLDPSRVIGKDFQLVTIITTEGRLIAGIARESSDATLLIQTPNERVLLSKDDILDTRASDVSMMPENIFDTLSEEEVRDLTSYLGAESQAPLPDGGK
jgi:putative membrane-bound dehydrogenase-like protein